jgi:hypothetical protein
MSGNCEKKQPCLPLHGPCDGFLITKSCCIPVSCPTIVCDPRIFLNLAGLTGNLNFQLFRLKGCQVEIELSSPCEDKVEGIICNVGTNFVDVKQDDNTVITVLIERIRLIKWVDPACNPCVPPPPCKPCSPC